MNGVKLIIGILLIISFFACLLHIDTVRAKKNYLYNQNYVIVKIGSDNSKTDDKFHTPKEYKILLAKSLRDTTMFIEWEVSTQKFYNSHIGDTLKFKFINKIREFKINR